MTRRQFLARLAAVPVASLWPASGSSPEQALEDDPIRICEGTGHSTMLTWRGARLAEGTGYSSVLRLSGGRFRFEGRLWTVRTSGSIATLNEGTGYSAAATLRGGRVAEGTGHRALWTIRQSRDTARICPGTSHSAEWTARGQPMTDAQTLATLVALEAVGA
ncbi:hypothetical protein [Rubrivirga sp.]|uniref:hypothetical protein n=1 Tax=Rubrivirga sp. TaxID=1885344 RepID=UPI003C75016D